MELIPTVVERKGVKVSLYEMDNNGDIKVVYNGDEKTIKRLAKDGGRYITDVPQAAAEIKASIDAGSFGLHQLMEYSPCVRLI